MRAPYSTLHKAVKQGVYPGINQVDAGRAANILLEQWGYEPRSDAAWRGLFQRHAGLQLLLEQPDIDGATYIDVEGRGLVMCCTHFPLVHPAYLEHCQRVYSAWDCSYVIHAGDVTTQHTASRYPNHENALTPSQEFEASKEAAAPWGEVFPQVHALWGNHDRNVWKQAAGTGTPSQFIRSLPDALGLPGWTMHESLVADGVFYRHRLGSTPQAVAKVAAKRGLNCIAGHYHTRAGVVFDGDYWGALVGCGVDRRSYDQKYNESSDPYVMACAVVDEGKTCHIIRM